ncbi:hypothetical protein KUV65_12465 [Maritalea mobilis]|uniref:SH3 domain-containing protein n=1 Tax=Maritalea mobilis TaxID=483324 RepID=UPI001C98CD3C|nr:hypothetical protein [Maritalea mobilis]MBY6202182.1 hypothetical protein [Maritalea mobilis]
MPRRLFALLAAATLAAPAAHATADGPDAWRVTGVASNDVLNVRVGPGTDYFVIDQLPHDARGVQMGVCVPTVTRDQFFALSPSAQAALNNYTAWCLVEWQGTQRGWVNRRYLTEDME